METTEDQAKNFLLEVAEYGRDPKICAIVDEVETAIDVSLVKLEKISSRDHAKYLTIMNLCGILGKLIAYYFPKDSLDRVCDSMRETTRYVADRVSKDLEQGHRDERQN